MNIIDYQACDHWHDDVVIERALAGKPTGRALTRTERAEVHRTVRADPARHPNCRIQALGITGRESKEAT